MRGGFEKRKRDHNIMFALTFEDGRTSYITVSPRLLQDGDHVVRTIARERQERGEIPDGEIVAIKRVR